MSEFPNYKYTAGLRNVGSYQVSGHPYITGSILATDQEVKVEFPFVSKSITLIASGAAGDIRAHWSPSSAGNVMGGKHYISLTATKDAMTINVKCKEMYVSCIGAAGADTGFQLFASLTNIATESMYELTGSGLTD